MKELTASEHREEALRLLEEHVAPWMKRWSSNPAPPLVISTPVQVALSAAQVHATLALSAGEG